MLRAKNERAIFSFVFALAVIGLTAVCLWFGTELNSAKVESKTKANRVRSSTVAIAATFPATVGLGAIADRIVAGCGGGVYGAASNVTFSVAGLSGSPTNVEVSAGITHTWVTDLDAVLIAPTGEEHILFARTRATTDTTCGDSSDLNGIYNFKDNCPGCTNWWDEAFANATLTPGDYRATESGGAGQVDPAPVTVITDSFSGIADTTGTWTLRVRDSGGGDTGSIDAASLFITTAAAGPVWLDRDGDGTTDYVMARATDTPLSESGEPFMRAGSYRERLAQKRDGNTNDLGATPIFWYGVNSSDSSTGVVEHGLAATDFITPNDFDGDGEADVAVWRTGPAMTAAFYILQSSTGTVRTELFGQTGDDSGVTGDYDGDGKADPAVFRCPTAAGQCTFFYRGSAGGGEITFVPWGFGTRFSQFANPGDFDGDGKHDFNVQRENPGVPGAGQFVLLRSSDMGVEFTNWGTNTDLIAPGDYDGDGRDDYTVVRNNAGQFTWYALLSGGGSWQHDWGITNDFLTPGDYDGDGKQDPGVWRPSTGTFWSFRSSDDAIETFKWGTSGDYPPANSQVH